MFTILTHLSIGFSVITCLLLLALYFTSYTAIEKTWLGNLSGAAMLLGLAGLQYFHLAFLLGNAELFESRFYNSLLLTAAPGFYLFGREILQFKAAAGPWLALHTVPLLLSLGVASHWFTLLAFVMGAGYSLHLALMLFALKSQRQHFTLEFVSIAVFCVIAVVILMVGLFNSILGPEVFVMAYANLIGISLAMMVYALMRFPDLIQKTRDAVLASYAASTLKQVDCAAKAAEIKHLFEDQHLHHNENLSLAELAGELKLSSHQTSELINTHFGQGFARLVREYRIADAKQQLVDEPRASVLSIGLSVGFNSQSNFYTAFREMTGQTPAQFRKSRGITATES